MLKIFLKIVNKTNIKFQLHKDIYRLFPLQIIMSLEKKQIVQYLINYIIKNNN